MASFINNEIKMAPTNLNLSYSEACILPKSKTVKYAVFLSPHVIFSAILLSGNKVLKSSEMFSLDLYEL